MKRPVIVSFKIIETTVI